MIPVTFPNAEGLKLFGILHINEAARKNKTGIIILSPGIKSRVAPHRLYIKMARQFEKMNFPVLRFDFYGLGDSEGEIDAKYTADLYGSIQVGRYIDDTKSAIDWMQNELGIEKFILAGLCGGAITGLHAAYNDKRINSILSLGIPVILDSANIDRYKFISKGQLEHLRSGYIKKALNPKYWLRILLLKSDFRLLVKSLFLSFKKKDSEDNKKINKSLPVNEAGNFNHYFPKIFNSFIENRKINLIFSGSDRLLWEFDEKFKSRYSHEIDNHKGNISLNVVKDANHIFSFTDWQIEMLEISSSWIMQVSGTDN